MKGRSKILARVSNVIILYRNDNSDIRHVIEVFYAIFVDWEIAYHDVSCGNQEIISDTTGQEPDIGLNECQERCLNEVQCKFILYGIDVWASTANRCILFRTCNDRTEYGDNNPNVYRRPSLGKK